MKTEPAKAGTKVRGMCASRRGRTLTLVATEGGRSVQPQDQWTYAVGVQGTGAAA
jgi:hypothetical protein